jgi:cathepsin B
MKAVIFSSIAIILLGLTLCSFRSTSEFITEQHLEQKRSEATFEIYSLDEHPFKNWSKSELQGLLGLSRLSLKDTSNIVYTLQNVDDLPENFDSRQQWPDCIHAIRNQGHCGSCWAHAASEVLSDRFCIASQGAVNVVLSPEDMVSCDYIDHGCSGGILTTSWAYLRFFGIVTDDCKPYTSGDGDVERCKLLTKKCRNETVEYKKYRANNFYTLNSIDAIKQNIFANGPVESGFSVYDDFLSYKSGIYRRGPSSKFLGGHAVKIVGWGVQDNTEYWIVANSWGEVWGEQGFFKIAFRECGIENCIAGDPKLN